MTDSEARSADSGRAATLLRLSGGLLVILGLANLALGVTAASTGLIRLPDRTSALLSLLGVATGVLGVLVARGSRRALVVALVVFGGLFVVQAFTASGGDAAPAVVTLAVVVLPLVLALRATRSTDGDTPGGG